MNQIGQITSNINTLRRRLKQKIRDAVEDVALDLQGKAQSRAPVDTGDLRGSANSKLTESNSEIVAEVGFSTPYALRQHEELSYNHPRGGEAKYLENPMKENETRYKQHIENAVRNGVS